MGLDVFVGLHQPCVAKSLRENIKCHRGSVNDNPLTVWPFDRAGSLSP